MWFSWGTTVSWDTITYTQAAKWVNVCVQRRKGRRWWVARTGEKEERRERDVRWFGEREGVSCQLGPIIAWKQAAKWVYVCVKRRGGDGLLERREGKTEGGCGVGWRQRGREGRGDDLEREGRRTKWEGAMERGLDESEWRKRSWCINGLLERDSGLLLCWWGLGLRLCIAMLIGCPSPAVLDGLRANCLSSRLSWSEANMVGGVKPIWWVKWSQSSAIWLLHCEELLT